MAAHDNDRTSSNHFARNLALVVLALALYVLGIGPAAWLYDQIEPSPAAELLAICYKPLILLMTSDIEPFSELIVWYTDFWANP